MSTINSTYTHVSTTDQPPGQLQPPLTAEGVWVGPVNVAWETVTPQKAREWLDHLNDGNRNLRQRHVDALVRDALNGDWLTTGESVKFDRNGRLIDGQHRLHMVVQLDEPVDLHVMRGLDPDVRGVLDTNKRRSSSDALAFAGMGKHRSLLGGTAQIRLTMDRREITLTGGTKATASNSEVLNWCRANPHAEELAPTADRLRRELRVFPSATLAAITRLYEVDPTQSAQFVEAIEERMTQGRGDPRLALIRSFDTIRTLNGTHQTGATLRAWFVAWNAWRDGTDLGIIKFYKTAPTRDTPGVGLPIPEPH